MRWRVAGRRSLSLLLTTCLFAVTLSVLPDTGSVEAQEAPESQVLLVSAIPEGPVVPGGIFFEKTFTINFSGGELSLSGDQGGSQTLFVDDVLQLSVVHEDGSSATFSHDFSGNCRGTIERDGPFDIRSYLEPGSNKVTVEFADQCGVGASSSDIWLVGDFEVGGGVGGPTRSLLVPAVEEGPVVPGGVFFEKTVTIRPAGGELLLSGDQGGTQPIFVDDILRLSIVHEDGSTATFSHDFSHRCQGFIAREGPFDIQSHLEPGSNDVRVELADQCGVGASNSDIWLVGDFQLGDGSGQPEARLAQAFGPPGSTTHGQNQSGSHADPVNTAIGAYYTSVVDATLSNIGLPFTFERSYTSADTTVGPLGIGWTHSLGAKLSVASNGDVTLRGEDGQQLLYSKQADGSLRAPAGGRSSLAAVADGYELIRRDQVRYRFDSAGRLQHMQDRNGQGLTLGYDSEGHLARAALSGGRTVRFRSNADGLLTSLRLPDRRRVRYAYADGRLSHVTDVRGKVTRYTYDAGGRLTSVIDPNGHAVVRNTYGSDGRVIEQRNALGDRTSFAWDPDEGIATITDALGNKWQHIYEDNVLVREIDPLGHETKYGYDSDLNRTSVTDPRGNTTTMEYDDRGNLIEQVAPAPLNHRQRFEYNTRNDPISATDSRGNTTAFAYDASGNLIHRTEPDGAVTRFTRDPAGTGLLASMTDPNGHTTRFVYDHAGNLTQTISPKGRVTTTTFDAGGRMVAVIDPRGNADGDNPRRFRTRLVYDRANQLRRVIDPLGHRTRYRYDPAGNLVRRTDANGQFTRYAYDEANRLVAVTAPDGAITRYAYDPNGNLVQRTDANGHATRYGYDEANRRIETRSPIGQRWTMSYDPAGNLTTLVTAAGNATPTSGDGSVRMAYDARNQPTKVDYSDDTPDVSFAYDSNGNPTQMTDGAGTETRAYDAQNRLRTVARGSSQFHYRYDRAGNLLRRTYPDGTQIDLVYNSDRQLTKATSGGQTTHYAYDPAGNLQHTSLPNRTTETRTYDRAGRLVRVRSTRGHRLISDVAATLDPVGNPLKEHRPEGTVRYRYDDRDRLTRACYSASCHPADGVIRYQYDPVGNRTLERRRGVPKAGTYHSTFNAADQLVNTRGPQGVVNYDYDLNGNQTAAGSRRYTYDLANRVTKASIDGHTTTYTYDGQGKRQTADTGGDDPRNRYSWDVNSALPQLAAEHDNDQVQRRYLYGNDRISMTTKTGTSYYHHDRIGSVTAMTSADGEREWAYSYEPFGTTRPAKKLSSDAPENPMQFAGEYLDPMTRNYHLRARDYDSTAGRFLQQDPVAADIRDPYTAAYIYANNRPTVLTDPSGLQSWKDTFGQIAFFAGIVAVITGFIAGALALLTASSLLLGIFTFVSILAGYVAWVTGVLSTWLECSQNGWTDSCIFGIIVGVFGLLVLPLNPAVHAAAPAFGIATTWQYSGSWPWRGNKGNIGSHVK
jgi:RHS repeat-associated protein